MCIYAMTDDICKDCEVVDASRTAWQLSAAAVLLKPSAGNVTIICFYMHMPICRIITDLVPFLSLLFLNSHPNSIAVSIKPKRGIIDLRHLISNDSNFCRRD